MSLGDVARQLRAQKNSGAAGQSAAVVETFSEAARLGDEQEQAAGTRTYFQGTLLPYFGRKYAPVLKSCFESVSKPDSSRLSFVVAIGRDGRMLRLYRDGETNIFQCMRATLEQDTFPAPPVAPYYLHIDMSFREGGQGGSPPSPAASEATASTPAAAPAAARPVARSAEAEKFRQTVRLALLREDFAELDKMAGEARSSKAQFAAGEWKLFLLYQELQTMYRGASEAEWQQHLDTLRRWMTERPQSITARVALADAYLQYAWAGRGGGYANQVTEEEWRLFGERTQKAGQILIEAAKLPAKCPQWYLEMQRVGLAQGLNKEQLTAIFEKAIAEPDYFFYYQEQAHSLLPKWMGEPGDIAAFAAESERRVGGKKGAAIYFLIAAALCNRCGDFGTADFSWPKLQEGFAALEELYGMNLLKLNQYARMAVSYGDKAKAAEAFARIGDQWDPRVWGDQGRYELQRSWAGLGASSQPTAVAPPAPDPARRMAEMLAMGQQAGNQGRWNEAEQAIRQAIEFARPLPGMEGQLTQAYLLLAGDEQRQGHVQQAEATLNEGEQAIAQKSGSDSEAAAQIADQSSALKERMGDDRQAEADLQRAIQIREKLSGLAAKQVTDDQTHLAWIWQREGRNKEAVELLQQVIQRIQPVRPKDPGIAQALAALAMTYQQMGSYQEAESAYLEWIHLLESVVPADSPELSIPYLRMASLYQAWGRQADAQRVEQKGKALEAGQR